MKFKKVENPMETITINGVVVVPDEVIEVELDDFDMDKYCEDHPDFDEAMNGMEYKENEK